MSLEIGGQTLGRRRVSTAAAVVCSLVVVANAAAQPQDPVLLEVGDAAPEISVARYVHAPEGAPTSLTDLRGKVVVLHFWASWCTGSIGAADHVNRLADSFSDRPVVSLTIANEDEGPLLSALERRPLRTWVALDDEGRTTDAYRVSGYPQSIVIDRQGRIAGFASPHEITAERLEALLAGEPVQFPHQYFARRGDAADPAWAETAPVEGDEDTVAQAILRRSYASNTLLRHLPTPGEIIGDGLTLDQLLSHAYDVSGHRFENRLPDSQERYRVFVEAPVPEHGEARALLRGLLERSFTYTARWESRPMDVVVVRRARAVDPEALGPSNSEVGGMASRTGFHVSGVPMNFITRALGSIVFDRVVVDETGMEGTYRLDVDWEPDDQESAVAALRSSGLNVDYERRDVEVLIVEPPQGP